jgi:Flp pilus assembly pilin Flp
MRAWKLFLGCLRDEGGAEVLEYAVLVGLLILVCVAALGAMGIRLQGRWHRLIQLVR